MTKFILRVLVNKLICLKVENAIIFFESVSCIAIRPDINNVQTAIMNKFSSILFNNSKNRIIMKIPAVTKVDEWTKADTGVGAAIAFGNQEEKGIWALFVIAVMMKIVIVITFNHFICSKFHVLNNHINVMEKINIISPKRFIKKVSIPELFL